MNAQSELNQDKSKANGKFQEVAKTGEKAVNNMADQVIGKGQELVGMAQDQVEDLYNNGGQYLKSTGDRAVKLAKTYPIQAAIGGIVVGLFLGAMIFGKSKAN